MPNAILQAIIDYIMIDLGRCEAIETAFRADKLINQGADESSNWRHQRRLWLNGKLSQLDACSDHQVNIHQQSGRWVLLIDERPHDLEVLGQTWLLRWLRTYAYVTKVKS